MIKNIICPFCDDPSWIDDDPTADYYFTCTHCGSYQYKDTFLDRTREQIGSLTIRIQNLVDLVRTK